MAYFSPFDKVYTLIAFAHAVTNENRRFSTRRKNPSAHAWRISRISLSKGPEAPRSTRAGRARARARALSTRKFQNSRFSLDNSQNNQGKRCLAPRVWQLCKSSAQSEPISKSYDQNKFIKVFF